MGMIQGRTATLAVEEDRRYRLKIMLVAERRPRYWDFHCIQCRMKICELSGVMVAVSDAADIASSPDYQPTPVVIKCRGQCHYWYEFETLS